MILYPLFPGGCDRCLTFSYDDGQIFDKRLVKIFNDHGMKATFNLNTRVDFNEPFVPQEEYRELYLENGHEIACHTACHPFMERMPLEAMLEDIQENRKVLEAITGAPVKGMAYPFGTYSQEEIRLLRAAGIVYSRTVAATNGFHLPEDWMEWHPTCHHHEENLFELAESFLKNRWPEGTVFYVWGHSFNFERENNWDIIERFSDQMACKPNIWYATNMEIYQYISAYRALQFTQDCSSVYNPSALCVLIRTAAGDFEIAPGKLVRLHS